MCLCDWVCRNLHLFWFFKKHQLSTHKQEIGELENIFWTYMTPASVTGVYTQYCFLQCTGLWLRWKVVHQILLPLPGCCRTRCLSVLQLCKPAATSLANMSKNTMPFPDLTPKYSCSFVVFPHFWLSTVDQVILKTTCPR